MLISVNSVVTYKMPCSAASDDSDMGLHVTQDYISRYLGFIWYTCLPRILSKIAPQTLSTVFNHFNPFIPEFLKGTHPFLNLDMSADAKRGLQSKTELQTV